MAASAGQDLVSNVEPTFAVHVLAVTNLLDYAERSGLALSREVQNLVEKRCYQLFSYRRNTEAAVAFARTLKEIAVRLFRQQRYREADARYRLASRFNPADPTLVSNRATCMYNVSRYQACIDLCNSCISDFPSMYTDRPMLYLKIMNRMGQANIELNNFAEARATYEALYNLKNSANSTFKLGVPDHEFEKVLVQFREHLNARAGNAQDDKGAAASPMRAENGQHNTSKEDGAEDEDKDENIKGRIEVRDLCHHIYDYANGRCTHPFPDGDHYEQSDASMQEEDDKSDSGSHSDADSVPTLVSSSEEDDDESDDEHDGSVADDSADSEMPLLLSDEDEASGTTGDEGIPGSDASDREDHSDEDDQVDISKHLTIVPHTSSGQRSASDKNRRKGSSQQTAANKPIDWTKAWKEPREGQERLRFNAPASSSSPQGKKALDGFKRGFLQSPSPESKPSSPPAPAPKKVRAGPSLSIPDKFKIACYETDEEKGPLQTGMLSERMEEDRTLVEFSNDLPQSQVGFSFDVYLSKLITEILGKSFCLTRAIDVKRLFGQHAVVASGGKRKKKVCDVNCGTCFATRMWKARFISSDPDEANKMLSAADADPRRNHQTYLPKDQWQGTGFYASGYELAYDLSALVHGVAYVSHLQAELLWHGNNLSMQKDIQYKFITALSKSFERTPNLDFIFTVFYVLRDTVNLFGLFPDPTTQGAKRSFQFCRSAGIVAKGVLRGAAGSSMSTRNDAVLSTKTGDIVRNTHSWAVLGQIAREEEWVYNILLRDVSHLLTTLTSKVKRSPAPHLLGAQSFAEAFEKACGDRSSEEKYWKCRVVTIISRERSRLLERNANAAKRAKQWEKCEQLCSSALEARVNQPRLLVRRAQVRAEQKKWKASLSDLRKCISIVNKGEAVVTSTRCKTPRNCLLRDLHTLEGNVLSQLSGGRKDESFDNAQAAVQSYRKAMAYNGNDDAVQDILKVKLEIAERHFATLEPPPGHAASRSVESSASKAPVTDQTIVQIVNQTADRKTSSGKSKRKKAKRGAANSNQATQQDVTATESAPISNVVATEPSHDSSSSEDDANGAFTNSRFGVLLDGGSSSTRTTENRPKGRVSTSRQQPTAQGWERVGKRTIQPAQHRTTSVAPTTTQVRNVTASSSSTSNSHSAPVDFSCNICNMRFTRKNDYDRHVRGRRHRTNLASSRGSQSSRHAANASNAGPTMDEAANEVERAMAILGGEARPSDVISRMNLTRWGVHDVNAYLQVHFGGLLQLCNQRQNTFQVVHAAGGRAMIMLVDRTGFMPLSQRNAARAAHRVARERAQQHTREDDDVVEMLRSRWYVTPGENRAATGEYEEEECGICLDNNVDTRIIPCGHVWCDRCIMANIQRDRYSCPKCNQPVERLERLGLD